MKAGQIGSVTLAQDCETRTRLRSLFFERGSTWPSDWYDSILTTIQYRIGKPFRANACPIALGEPLDGRPRECQGVPDIATGVETTRTTIENSVGCVQLMVV